MDIGNLMYRYAGRSIRGLSFGLAACLAGSFLTSCAIVESGSYIAPSTQLESKGQYSVIISLSDDRSLHQTLLDAMLQVGLDAKAGLDGDLPPCADYLVRYGGQWQRDLTWYLLYFELRIYDPQSKQLLASASSLRTSLVRMSADEMVREVLGQLFPDSATH